MPVDAARAKFLFLATADLTDAAARAAYLELECGGDVELRARVEALLRANDAVPLLPGTAAEDPRPHDPHGLPSTGEPVDSSVALGTVLAGRYKLLEEIGDGGMGTVWMAEQREPVKRLVAVKLIKAGMDSKAVLARFEAERQALALMDHPNIAKVLDGGTTDDSKPFFVMELVKGLPLTEYCDARRLSVTDRLNLFVQICSALQHAHQKAVIHRDLKPSNVLVTEQDGRAVPKVIDFGLAKALNASNMLTERTLHTAYGTVVGTPLYIAPEQVGINALDVDTRTDIYALGVMLYELLVGSTPLEKARFKEAAWDEVKRLIREEEPPRPSTRLSSSAGLPSLAASRQTEPAQLSKLLRGELDWIVMKALEKDRSRRYETANGFAADVQRFLAGEPVLAVPPSTGYRLRKFARKNRTALTTAAAIAALLVTGIVGTTLGLIRANRAAEAERQATLDADAKRVEAESARQAEAEQRLIATANEKHANEEREKAQHAAAAEKLANEQAQKRLAQIERANVILGSVFEGLDVKGYPGLSNWDNQIGLRLLQKLDGAADQLESEGFGDPLILAGMQVRLARWLSGMRETSKAIDLLEKALAVRQAKLGLDHPDTITTRNTLATVYQDAGRRSPPISFYEDALQRTKARFGPEHDETLRSMTNLGRSYQSAGKPDLAIPLFAQTLIITRTTLGPEHQDTIASINHLAGAYRAAGKLNQSLPLSQESLANMQHLATAYKDAGEWSAALPFLETLLKDRKAILGPDHRDTLTVMHNLALAYRADRNPEKHNQGMQLLEETLKLRKTNLGADDPDTLACMCSLAAAYQA
jgi:serine/threonine protein kinase